MHTGPYIDITWEYIYEGVGLSACTELPLCNVRNFYPHRFDSHNISTWSDGTLSNGLKIIILSILLDKNSFQRTRKEEWSIVVKFQKRENVTRPSSHIKNKKGKYQSNCQSLSSFREMFYAQFSSHLFCFIKKWSIIMKKKEEIRVNMIKFIRKTFETRR